MSKYQIPAGPSMAKSFLRSFEMVKEPIRVITENMALYGDTYAVKAGIDKYIIVTQDPGFIEHVLKKNHKNYAKSNIASEKLGRFLGKGLLTSNGEYWLRQRRLIQPGFHRQKIQNLYEVMQNTIDEFLSGFPTGKDIDVYPLTNKLAFKIVIRTLFNIPMHEKTMEELAEIISEVQEYIVKEIRQPYKYFWFVVLGAIKKNLARSERARDIIREIIRERKAGGKKVEDLLDMLLEAKYEDSGASMNEEQIIDEILILIVAGHETSANALAWALHLLATHPDELENLKVATRNLSIEETVANKKLASVIKEAMRMFPPAWISDRVAIAEDKYGDYTFPKDAIIVLFFYGTHYHKTHWETPMSFTPERFADESADKVVKDIFYPFGAGPRFCIGSGFAMAEMALFLKSFIRQFNIKPTGKPPTMIPLITLRPDEVVLEIEKI